MRFSGHPEEAMSSNTVSFSVTSFFSYWKIHLALHQQKAPLVGSELYQAPEVPSSPDALPVSSPEVSMSLLESAHETFFFLGVLFGNDEGTSGSYNFRKNTGNRTQKEKEKTFLPRGGKSRRGK